MIVAGVALLLVFLDVVMLKLLFDVVALAGVVLVVVAVPLVTNNCSPRRGGRVVVVRVVVAFRTSDGSSRSPRCMNSSPRRPRSSDCSCCSCTCK